MSLVHLNYIRTDGNRNEKSETRMMLAMEKDECFKYIRIVGHSVVKDVKEGECLKYIRAVGHRIVKDVKIS